MTTAILARVAHSLHINYTTQDGTATVADGDYTAATGTVNFAPGETSKTITVNATGDTKFEANETFQVALTGPFNGPVAPGSIVGSGTITNDDAPPTISIGNVSQNEGNSGTTAYSFTVSLSNASSQTVAVNYTTADGTATVADSDYVATAGSLSFAPGETSKTITVLVNGDTKFEANQAFSVALSNASNGTLGTSTGTGTIVNDDTRPRSVSTTSARLKAILAPRRMSLLPASPMPAMKPLPSTMPLPTAPPRWQIMTTQLPLVSSPLRLV
jgi:hypothetical protein